MPTRNHLSCLDRSTPNHVVFNRLIKSPPIPSYPPNHSGCVRVRQPVGWAKRRRRRLLAFYLAMGTKGGSNSSGGSGGGGGAGNGKQPPSAPPPQQQKEEERGARPPRPVSLNSPGGTSAFELHVMAAGMWSVLCVMCYVYVLWLIDGWRLRIDGLILTTRPYAPPTHPPT